MFGQGTVLESYTSVLDWGDFSSLSMAWNNISWYIWADNKWWSVDRIIGTGSFYTNILYIKSCGHGVLQDSKAKGLASCKLTEVTGNPGLEEPKIVSSSRAFRVNLYTNFSFAMMFIIDHNQYASRSRSYQSASLGSFVLWHGVASAE